MSNKVRMTFLRDEVKVLISLGVSVEKSFFCRSCLRPGRIQGDCSWLLCDGCYETWREEARTKGRCTICDNVRRNLSQVNDDGLSIDLVWRLCDNCVREKGLLFRFGELVIGFRSYFLLFLKILDE